VGRLQNVKNIINGKLDLINPLGFNVMISNLYIRTFMFLNGLNHFLIF
jgi:hypothetical protein